VNEVTPTVHKRAVRTPWSAEDAEALLFAHTGPVLVLDGRGCLQAGNAPALELLGLITPDDFHNRLFVDFLSSDSPPTWEAVWQRLTVERIETRCELELAPLRDHHAALSGPRRIEFAGRPIIRGRRVVAVQAVLRLAAAQPTNPLSRQQRITEALQQVMAIVNSTLDLEAVLAAIVERLKNVVPYDGATVLLKEQGHYRMASARGFVAQLDAMLTSNLNDLPTVRALLQARGPVYIPDTQADPLWLPLREDNPVRSWLGLPLFNRRQDEILGILNIDHNQPNAYDEEDIQVAYAFATQAAAAIENARLYAEVQRRADYLAALNSVSATVSQSLDLETALNRALDEALAVVGFEAGAISLIDEEAQELVIRVHRGWRQQDLVSNMRVKLGQGLSGQAVLTGEVIVTGSLDNEPRLAIPQVRGEGVRSMALAPMRARGRVVGVLGVMSYEPRRLAPHSIDVIKSIADQIGVALDNAQLFARATNRSQQLALLNEVTRDVLSTLDMSERFQRITHSICEKFGYDSVAVFMVDPDRQRLSLRSNTGTKARQQPGQVIRQSINQGLVGYVTRTGESVIVGDVSQDARYYTPIDPADDRTRSELAVPLKRGDEVVGVLDIEHTELQAFSAEDAEMMQALADLLVIAITNGELYEQASQHVAELMALQAVSLQVTASLDLWSVLDTIERSALTLIRADYTHIFLYDPDRHTLVFGAALRQDGVHEPRVMHLDPEGLTWQTFRGGRAIIVNDAPGDPQYAAAAAFPLKRPAGAIGVAPGVPPAGSS